MAWTKNAEGKWEETYELKTVHAEAEVYYRKVGISKRKNLLDRLKAANLTPDDAGMLNDICYGLSQGISIASQSAAIDTDVADMPNAPKPVEEAGDRGEVGTK